MGSLIRREGSASTGRVWSADSTEGMKLGDSSEIFRRFSEPTALRVGHPQVSLTRPQVVAEDTCTRVRVRRPGTSTRNLAPVLGRAIPSLLAATVDTDDPSARRARGAVDSAGGGSPDDNRPVPPIAATIAVSPSRAVSIGSDEATFRCDQVVSPIGWTATH